MAREELITRQDREVWERYRLTWRSAPEHQYGEHRYGPGSQIDGVEAARIAAYLDDNLSEAERRAVERRLVENPALLDALIAAKAGLHDGPTHAYAASQSVRAWALNVYQAELAKRARPAAATPGRRMRRRQLLRPALAAAAASLVLVLAAGVGTFFLSRERPQTVAQNERTTSPPKPSEAWDPRTNSIFADPENAYFDGLDVD